MSYHKPITVEMARKAVEQGCGDNSCLFVKPKGMATNGGCRCFDKRSAHQLLRDLALALAVCERPAAVGADEGGE